MYYYEYLLIPFLAASGLALAWCIVWTWDNFPLVSLKPDPRWKNRNTIVNFLFATIMIEGTLIISLIGATL